MIKFGPWQEFTDFSASRNIKNSVFLLYSQPLPLGLESKLDSPLNWLDQGLIDAGAGKS